jgi:DNA-damage-inducible protein D
MPDQRSDKEIVVFDIQRFEDLAKQNGVRFWDAREFMGALGYDTWSSFQQVINRSISSCAQLGVDISEVFIPFHFVDGDKQVSSYKLTRFACLLVAMHADSKKPQVAQAKVALAGLADALIAQQLGSHVLERIEIRDELKHGEGIMAGAAKAAGLANQEYGIFKDAGIRGMYDMSLARLVSYKGGDPKKTLYDFMGKTELAANLFRVTQTAERINNLNVKGLANVTSTAKSVGAEVRSVMLRSGGTAPENLPLEEDINTVKRKLKTTHKEMHKLDNGKPKPKISKK